MNKLRCTSKKKQNKKTDKFTKQEIKKKITFHSTNLHTNEVFIYHYFQNWIVIFYCQCGSKEFHMYF